MRTLIRALPLALAAALLALFAIACNSGGSDGDDQTRSDQPAGQTDGQTASDDGSGGSDGGSGDFVSAAPVEVLSESAKSFEQEVQSLQVEMAFTITTGGADMDMTGNMAFQAPDQMHMTMDVTGLGSFEMLMLGTDIYMDVAGQGWVVFSMEDMLGGLGVDELGLDSESFQDTFSQHGFVDYKEIIESVGGDVEDLGEETVDGETYQHYRATLDFADLAAAFSDAFSFTEDLDLDDASGPLTFDVWVDPDTFLPYKLAASGEFAFGADEMVFDASMRFFGYNEPVQMPAPPEDAVSLAELFSGLFEGEQ